MTPRDPDENNNGVRDKVNTDVLTNWCSSVLQCMTPVEGEEDGGNVAHLVQEQEVVVGRVPSPCGVGRLSRFGRLCNLFVVEEQHNLDSIRRLDCLSCTCRACSFSVLV